MAALGPDTMHFLDKHGWPVERFMNEPVLIDYGWPLNRKIKRRSWWRAFVNFTRLLIHTRRITLGVKDTSSPRSPV